MKFKSWSIVTGSDDSLNNPRQSLRWVYSFPWISSNFALVGLQWHMAADLCPHKNPQPGRALKTHKGQQRIRGGLAPISTSKVGHRSDLLLIRLNKFFQLVSAQHRPFTYLSEQQHSLSTYLLYSLPAQDNRVLKISLDSSTAGQKLLAIYIYF